MIDKRNDDELFEQDLDQSEFQFSDDDEVPVYAEEKQAKTGPGWAGRAWKKLRTNKIVLVIAILVVVYLAYQVVQFASGLFQISQSSLSPVSNPAPKPVSQVIPTPPAATQQQIQTLSQQTEVAQQSITGRLTTLEGQSASFQKTLMLLQQQAMNNASQIAAVQTQLESINQALLALSNQAKPKPVAKKPGKSKASTSMYYVQAIVPGRAWLQTSDGKTITVSPGDTVSKYGRVTRVDPDNGTVSTTSGTVFRFAISEN